jgi:hypothetical protein
VKDGKIKFKRKGGIAYGLGGTQGEVEVQMTFGTSADRFCTRFAAPTSPWRYDTSILYKSKVFDGGTASCSAVPSFCGPCAQRSRAPGVRWHLRRGLLVRTGTSCDTACAAVGKTCDAATITYAGSGGTTSNCGAVLAALFGAGGAGDADCTGFGAGLGCFAHGSGDEFLRCIAPPTTCAASLPFMARACACQ